MRRMSFPKLVLAAMLALLLPLEQAHCVWMGFEQHAAPVAGAAVTGHECCAAPASPDPGRATTPASGGCVCEQLPTGALPTVFAVGSEAPAVASIAMLTAPTTLAPVSILTGAVPALDVGSSPPPDDPGAHGLRAPPASV